MWEKVTQMMFSISNDRKDVEQQINYRTGWIKADNESLFPIADKSLKHTCKHIHSPEQVFQHYCLYRNTNADKSTCSDNQPDQLKLYCVLNNQKDDFKPPDRPRQPQTQYQVCIEYIQIVLTRWSAIITTTYLQYRTQKCWNITH